MGKRHQYKASGKKTRKGQHQKGRHRQKQSLQKITKLGRREIRSKY